MNLTLYLIIIVASWVIASVAISLAQGAFFWYVFGVIVLGTALVIIIDAITATVCRLLPRSFANFKTKIYLVGKREKAFYEKLLIRKWKDLIPEIGHFTGFRKNKILEPKNPEYIKRFLIEICYGELGHTISVFTGFLLIILPWFSDIWLPIALVVAFVNAFLNILPVIVLRYNSFKLNVLYKSLNR